MKIIFLVLSVLFCAPIAEAQIQALHLSQGCSFDSIPPEKDIYAYPPSEEADRIVQSIVDAIGLEKKSFTLKSSNVKNALATTLNGQRFILYSTDFLEKFKADSKTKWAAYAVLAHEIGHHLSGHNFGETDSRIRKMMELEAEHFAGCTLGRLGATLLEAEAGLHTFELAGETPTHPSKTARLEALSSGWVKCGNEPGDGSDVEQDEPIMIIIPKGAYPIGTKEEEYAALAKEFGIGSDNFKQDLPFDNFQVAQFEISKFEITVKEYDLFLKSSGTNPPRNWDSQKTKGNNPVTLVSLDDAIKYCDWLSNQTHKKYRLPTEEEWEIAARGKDRRAYPWGKPAPTIECVNFKNHYGGLVAVEERPCGESFFRVRNMAGNVAEWCSSPYGNGMYVVRGGSYRDGAGHFFRCAHREGNRPNEGKDHIGFRVIREY